MIQPGTRGLARLAQLVVIAVLVGIGVSHVVFAIRDWPLGDMDVYLAAAARLRDGQPLYVSGDIAVNSFWYAPWYAVLWVPLTYLPREVVAVAWSAVLLAATAAVTLHLWRRGPPGRLLAIFAAPPLIAVSAGGNIQSLMVLGLLLGFHRRWGPLAVALAASMKFTPILLTAAYVARGEYRRAAWTLALAVVLLVPSLLLGIADTDIRSDAALSLLGVAPVLYILTVLAALGATFVVPRRHAVLVAAVAAVLALPRLFVYDTTLVVIGAAKDSDPATER